MTSVAAGPLLLVLSLHLVASQIERGRDLELPVSHPERAPALVQFLARQQVAIVAAPPDLAAAVRAGNVDVGLAIDERFEADVEAGRRAKVSLYYDRSRDRARSAIAEVEALLQAYNDEWGRGRLLMRGVAPDVAEPLDLERHDLSTPQSAGSLVLVVVAFYGLFASLVGAMAAALDSTAGERERSSLEPLLATPATPAQIVMGKWLALCALDAVVVGATLAGFYLTLRFAPLPSVGVPFLFGLDQLAAFVGILGPLVALAPALLLYVGLRGRSIKEAQANVSVLLFAASALSLVQMYLPGREPAWLVAVPIAGQYSLLSHVLRGEMPTALDAALSCVAPLVLALCALGMAARLLSRESILAGR